MKKFFLPALILFSSISAAQLPETDIFISRVKEDNGKLTFSQPENITSRKGYDNQPYFMPDGKSILYVAIPDSTQSEVYRYNFSSKKVSQVTHTLESEYSPMMTPDGNGYSVVRVDTDKAQRFYTFNGQDKLFFHVVPGTDSIGYNCWLNDSTLAMFILGNSMTLQLLNMKTAQRVLIASDVGRCMKLSLDKKSLYFVIKQNEIEWSIFEMNISSGEKRKVVTTLAGSEDYALMPDGSFLMGSKGKLFRYSPGNDKDWIELVDFSAVLGDFYRIAVSPKGDMIALVAFTGKKP